MAESIRTKHDLQVTAEPGKQELVLTRIIDAPRSLVFKAMTDPSLIPEWWGPIRYTTAVDKMEARPGGIWRFVHRDAAGNEYAFKGVYHEVLSPERIVYTFEFEGAAGHVSLETATFEDLGNRTKMTDKVVYQSVEDRDEMLKAGMLEGARETMDRFAEVLERLGIEKKAA
ncbi:MAG: ATPase [Nitrospirae bacterium GWD2_57_9]|nr:MAG: ATPase [Nitrospirae bacterium GWD2_57_9]OGW49733.1 MAG: ATPase [Nitrospirae bacterium GWC2_57_9]